LSLPAFFKYAAGGDLLAEVADHVPDGVNALAGERRAGIGFGAPAFGGRGEIMQRPVVVGAGGVGADAVGLIP